MVLIHYIIPKAVFYLRGTIIQDLSSGELQSSDRTVLGGSRGLSKWVNVPRVSIWVIRVIT